MANYQLLKADIDEKVYQNGRQEITGANLNSVLNAMVTTLGAGYQFIGVATPTNPDSAQTPDYNCFYLATTPGTYTNLGGLVVADGEVALLKWDTSWTKEVTGIANAAKLSQLGQEIAYQPSNNIDAADLLWQQKTIISYVASDSPNRCIALVPASNVSHLKVVPSEGWYINVWFYSKGTSSDNLDANIGITSSGSAAETIEMDMPEGCEMIALWCRKADQSNFDKSVAYQAYNSIEFVLDKDKLANLEALVNTTLPVYIKVYPTAIRRQNYDSLLPDANNALINTKYFVYTNQGTKPEHFPSGYPADGSLWFLTTYKSNIETNEDYIYQTLVKESNDIFYYRSCVGGVWGTWNTISPAEDTSMHIFPTAIRRQNYQTLLPDANNALDNTEYLVYTNQGAKPNNFPDGYSADGNNYILRTTVFDVDGTILKLQTLSRQDNSEYYYRQYFSGMWTNWESSYNKDTIYVGTGQQFTTIKAALEYSNSIGNLNIKVLDGTYDIIEEYGGQEALETAVTNGDYGLVLGFGNTIEFSTRTFVTCNYEGSNNLVKERFSPFNASTSENISKQGFTVEGLNISCKNVRYCVHDETAGTAKFRHHKYINCTMYMDNTNNPYNFIQCIGGGLGKEVRIDIIGGIYKSETATSIIGSISYHNAAGTGVTANARSEINVDGVYFDGNGSISFGYYGASTLITNCYVRNCSMGVAPNVHAETESSTVVNMQLKAWNNEIRS